MSEPTIELTIDGHRVSVSPGTTLWDAARQLGIAIPGLCHHPRLRPVGVCRLCVVDVGGRVLAAACVRPCEEGMTVVTHSARVEKHRRTLTGLLLAEHPTPCTREQTTGDCELEALGRRYGLSGEANAKPQAERRDHSSPVIAVDHAACILCDRCLRGCNDVQSNHVLGRSGKGHTTKIAFDLDQPMGQSTCVSCGECAAVCPTGALTNKPLSLPLVPKNQTTAVDSVCPYCGVGCAITYHVKENRILWAEGRESPVNHSRLCVKGRYGWDYAHHAQRLTRPLIRRAEGYPKGQLSPEGSGERTQDAVFRPATWEEALDLVAQRLGGIKAKHGPTALAGFGSAKCSNEEAYLFQKLMRAALGTNNVDHCTRLCHASSVAALLEGIGSGAVTDVFGDAAQADLLLLTGSNTTENHPVAATFFKEAVKQGTRLIVVDPRRPAIADFATWYCRIKPGTDVAFYNALMNVLIGEDLVNRGFLDERTEGFEALSDLVVDYTPNRVAGVCGIDADTIREVARAIGTARAMMIFWGMGISQHSHGTDNARCLIALCLLTGNIGRRGTGLHPLRGQNNVQGASDAGLIPMVYPDYQPVGSREVRRKFEAAWGVPLDSTPGLTVVEIMQAALDGRIKGMYMLGENPFLSDPNINKVKKALAHLEFLVVQDIFLTETAEFADVVLPATSFFEKTGTYTNTDRRVQIGRQALKAPGEARPDWEVICDLSRRLGYPMSYAGPEEVFAEFTSLTRSYQGLTYPRLAGTGKLWPCPDPENSDGEAVLFGEDFPTPTRRAKFVPCAFAPAQELPDDAYPLVLNTGRLLEHWHTGTMTRRATALDALQPRPFVEVHADDLIRFGVRDGDLVTVRSRRGAIRLEARASARSAPGSVFIPFHFHEAAANVLTNDALDPHGKIPEFKFCAVRLEPSQTAVPDGPVRVTAYIALGSNLGDRRNALDRALELLRAHPRVAVGLVSSYHETDPVGGPPGQAKFLNAAAELHTDLAPEELLRLLIDIEVSLGRVRQERWGPRTIDLDLLLYGDVLRDDRELTLPHPRMVERLFVLAPLVEIAPDRVYPRLGVTIRHLYERLTGRELSGLCAVVTGSTSGIGRAIALALAAGGAEVLVHGRRSRARAEEVAAQTRGRFFLTDLRDPLACRVLVEEAWAVRGGIDVWVNNAGADTLTGEAAHWSFERKLKELWAVDVAATLLLSREVGARMKTRGRGLILNMGWDQADTGMEGDSGQLFGSAKAAVMAFSKSLALTLAPEVRVNCLAPGWIRTAWGEGASSVWQERVVRETPLRRWGTPEDVAALARWLASPAASYVTGQIVRINGGAVR